MLLRVGSHGSGVGHEVPDTMRIVAFSFTSTRLYCVIDPTPLQSSTRPELRVEAWASHLAPAILLSRLLRVPILGAVF